MLALERDASCINVCGRSLARATVAIFQVCLPGRLAAIALLKCRQADLETDGGGGGVGHVAAGVQGGVVCTALQAGQLPLQVRKGGLQLGHRCSPLLLPLPHLRHCAHKPPLVGRQELAIHAACVRLHGMVSTHLFTCIEDSLFGGTRNALQSTRGTDPGMYFCMPGGPAALHSIELLAVGATA